MRFTRAFIKTFKETPKSAENISSALLLRGGYILKVSAGIYDFLPLGWRVMTKIMEIIRQEMNDVDGQEVFLPTLQPRQLWEETGRWKTYDPPLLVVKDRHKKEFALSPTHEEIITDLARKFIESYKDLPQMIYQFQNKLRNEIRPTGGLLRQIEFLMKDAYSFHADDKDADSYYQKIITAYKKIFDRVGVQTRVVEAHSGSIGGEVSNEFMLLAETGEDRIYLCQKCDWAANVEVVREIDSCPKCQSKVTKVNAIEVGHAFKLGTLYSEKMAADFLTQEGKQKPIIMGCYGIGIGRLMAAIVEANHDNNGIIWPQPVAPYKVYLVELVKDRGQEIYNDLIKSEVDVLYDDRDVSAGVKFADADLLGIPWRVVVGQKMAGKDQIETKMRNSDKTNFTSLDKFMQQLR